MAAASLPRPLVLTIPGLSNSGPGHWQTIWEQMRDDCRRVELGCWDEPIRNVWMSRIDQAVHDARGEVVLVAHSLGCHAVAWWAHLLGASGVSRVKSALLVAPPDVDSAGVDARLARFAPSVPTMLPFPTLVAASRSDPYASLDYSRSLAGQWGALLVDFGDLGHINAQSAIGSWSEGQQLLDLLTGTVTRATLAERVAGRSPIRPTAGLPGTADA